MKETLMPLLALVCGLISLYVDPKQKQRRWLLLGGLFATATVTIVFNIGAERASAARIAESRAYATHVLSILDRLVEQTRSIPDVVRRLE